MPLFGPPNVEKLLAKHDIAGLIKALSYDKDPTICHAAAKALGQTGDPQAVEPLIQALKSNDPTLRASSIVALGRLAQPETITHIIAALTDKDPTVRKAAIITLGAIGSAEGIEPLLGIFAKQETDLYPDTLQALVKIATKTDETIRNEQIIQPLGDLLAKESQEVCAAIIDALQQMGWKPDNSAIAATYYALQQQWDRCIAIGAPAADALIGALSHEDKNVRQEAFQALVQIGAPVADALIETLNHSNHEVQQAAFWSLVKIGKPIMEQLVAALKHEHEDVRRSCATALGHLGDPQVVIPLISMFNDTDWSVRRDAYKAVVKIGKPALPQLLAALKHENGEVRWGAAGTLEALGWKPSKDEIGAQYWVVKGEWHNCIAIGEPAVSPLIDSLGHWDTNVCKEAMGALIHIGKPSVMPLIQTLQHEKPGVRKCAATALGMIGDERAEEPLRQLLSDRDKEVGQAATEAISAIETGEVWRGTS